MDKPTLNFYKLVLLLLYSLLIASIGVCIPHIAAGSYLIPYGVIVNLVGIYILMSYISKYNKSLVIIILCLSVWYLWVFILIGNSAIGTSLFAHSYDYLVDGIKQFLFLTPVFSAGFYFLKKHLL